MDNISQVRGFIYGIKVPEPIAFKSHRIVNQLTKNDLQKALMGTETNSGYKNNHHISYPHYQLRAMIDEIKDMDIVEKIIKGEIVGVTARAYLFMVEEL